MEDSKKPSEVEEQPEGRFFLKDKLCALGLADVSTTYVPFELDLSVENQLFCVSNFSTSYKFIFLTKSYLRSKRLLSKLFAKDFLAVATAKTALRTIFLLQSFSIFLQISCFYLVP